MVKLSNADVAALFAEMADLIELEGGDAHRVASFRRGARSLEGLPEPLESMIRFGTLEQRAGVGPGIVRRVKEILRTGRTEELGLLRRRVPPGLREMMGIHGLGPKTVRRIHRELGVSTVAELEASAHDGRLLSLRRMGPDTVHKILRGIEAQRSRAGRVPRALALRLGGAVAQAMAASADASRIMLAGSLRRGKATIGDLDLLVGSDDPLAVTSRFVTLPMVAEVLASGQSRASVRLESGPQMDLRVLPPENWGAGLHYFTGSQQHNIALRTRAGRMGLHVSDHGVFRRSDEVRILPGTREEDIFAAVGLPWIPPELRENQGELEVADAGRLPRLLEDSDLLGDLHMHTVDSDGGGTALEMVSRAERLGGHRYIAITDHSKAMSIAHGLDERRLLAQGEALRAFSERPSGLRVLRGVEVDILPDGQLDLDLEVLGQLEWVVASVHVHRDQDASTMTQRIVRAMESGVVDVIGHPTGRRPGARDAYAVELDVLFDAARRTGVALELNGGPNRMDLPDEAARQATTAGVDLVLSTDAHAPEQLGRRDFALAMARRGWVEPRHVLNTRPWEFLAQRRRDRKRSGGVFIPAAAELQGPVDGDGAAPHAWDESARTDGALGGAVDLTSPLSDAVRERVVRFLAEGADPDLEAALLGLGLNALQVAFGLLHSAGEPSE